jgi:hypothetical protein
MPKRLSRERIEQIRAEVKAWNRGDIQFFLEAPTARLCLTPTPSLYGLLWLD